MGKRSKQGRRMTGQPVRAVIVRPVEIASALDSPAAGPVTWGRALLAWRGKLQSAQTRATYTSAVRQFCMTPGVPDLHALDVDRLDAFAWVLRARAESIAPPVERLAPSTVNLKLAALRSFLGFARRRGWLSPLLGGEQIADALEGVRATVQRPHQIIEGDELPRMLDAAAADGYDAPRALALVGLALGAGLRVAELCALSVGDLANDATGCYVDVRAGKGHKQRQVPISQDVYELVSAYLSMTSRAIHRTADRSTPLFLSRKSRAPRSDGSPTGQLTTRQARRIIVTVAQRAGVSAHKRITPHALRHSYAIDLLACDEATGRPSAPLPIVSAMLGHSSIAVTGRYLRHFERRDQAKYAPTLRRPAAS